MDGAGLVRCVWWRAGDDLEVVAMKTETVSEMLSEVKMDDLLPRMTSRILIDQHNLYGLVEL